ncbi:hypothetical protein Afil01_56440 [Actinorhabdospora filicis]|uniref:Uncharacterized protein n=1 Tax=Actinorhabdospora filicis TaxID=1785913 RepID=A0A9W6SS54_9ACTN|nr:hypothetical protein [Actinorhabdospora filicis]GLZ80837.1 hypothetical protein Afil01_56440 [Actinorhabdospora filicis]
MATAVAVLTASAASADGFAWGAPSADDSSVSTLADGFTWG